MRPELTKILATLSKAEMDELLDYLKFRGRGELKRKAIRLSKCRFGKPCLAFSSGAAGPWET